MKQLQFKQIVAVFNESARETDLYGLMDGGALYRQRREASEGWEAISTHRYEPPAQEKPQSKSMQRDKHED